MKRRKPSLPSVINYDDLSEVFSGKITTFKKFKHAGNSPFGSKVESCMIIFFLIMKVLFQNNHLCFH